MIILCIFNINYILLELSGSHSNIIVIVGVIWRKPVLTHASIVCEGMLASVNSVKKMKKLRLSLR